MADIQSFDVANGVQDVDLGIPPASGWKIHVIGQYGDGAGGVWWAPGIAKFVTEPVAGKGCVYVRSTGGEQPFIEREDIGSHHYVKLVGGTLSIHLGFSPQPEGTFTGSFQWSIEE